MNRFIPNALIALHELAKEDFPVFLAPMAGSGGLALALAVARGGGIASLPCAMSTPEQIAEQVSQFRAQTKAPIHLNFFAYQTQDVTAEQLNNWQNALAPYYQAYKLDPNTPNHTSTRAPFNEDFCAMIEELKPEFVSFHFGLPDAKLVERVKATGTLLLASATTLDEGIWLEEHGCDILIAQGMEAGGHRGHFLSDDLNQQKGLFSLLPLLVERCHIPVIAAGGVATQKHIRAARKLGACGVQIGTAFLSCEESLASQVHRAALMQARTSSRPTTLTRVFSGRYARGFTNRAIEELRLSPAIPPFPHASAAWANLRAHAEAQGCDDFSPLWAGQSAGLSPEITSAEALTRHYMNTFYPEIQHI